MKPTRFSSITHLHIYAIINTIIKFKFSPANKKTLRLLDVGCGNGVMLSSLIKELPDRHPGIRFEFFGLDVDDSHVQESGYFDKTISLLESTSPGTSWKTQLKLIKSTDNWPFPDNYFDLIFSNQVLEHVFNQQFAFGEIRRTMQDDGYSFHLFPLRHYIYEGHMAIPFVHKFSSWTTTYHWIKWATFWGWGTYKANKKKGRVSSVHEYAETHADYLVYQVNYQTARQVSATAKHCRLKASFDFTYLYYKQKLRSLLKMPPLQEYRQSDIVSAKNIFYFAFLKYVTGITMVIRKEDTF